MVGLTLEERQEIVKYVEQQMESGQEHWTEFRCATPEETIDQNIQALRHMLMIRGLTTTGKKGDLIARLHTTEPNRQKMKKRCYHAVFHEVWRLIDRDDSGGCDMPEGMSRAKYWLAKMNPEFIRM